MERNNTCQLRDQCPKKTDEELVEFVLANKQCYVCLMERYEEKILRYIQRISGLSREGSEDIAQEVFLKVFINLNSFDRKMKFSSWLYRIAHNETINYWRRNKKTNESAFLWDDFEGLRNIIKDSYNLEQEVYQKLNNRKLVETIGQLSDKYREVLILNYLEGKSYQEIADVLNKPIGTVGTLINRAKKALAVLLKKQGINSYTAFKS